MALLTGKYDPVKNIPQINSKSDAWVAWHQTLKSNFGKKVANQLWLKAWSKRGTNNANTADLRDYMSKQGIDISKNHWDEIVDLAGDATDYFSGVYQVAQYAALALGIIAIGGLGMIVFNIARRPAESVGLAARAFVTKGK